MKKLGCAKCGGTKKMKLGGSAVAKAPVNMYGIPQENMGTSSQMGFGKKGGTLKVHPLTAFRKFNDDRNKKLTKAKDGISTRTLATELYGTKKETVGNNVNTYRVLDNKGRTIGVRPSSKIAATKENVGKPRVRAGVSAKTPAAPKSANPTSEPRIKFGDPMVGIPASKPKPKGRYEDAVINTKSPSTRTAAIPRSSAKAPVQHTSGYTPKRGETTTVKKTVGPRPSVDEMREANIKKYSVLKSKIAEDKKPKSRSAVAEFKAGMTAGPVGYAAKKVYDMMKKNGGAVKSKKKK